MILPRTPLPSLRITCVSNIIKQQGGPASLKDLLLLPYQTPETLHLGDTKETQQQGTQDASDCGIPPSRFHAREHNGAGRAHSKPRRSPAPASKAKVEPATGTAPAPAPRGVKSARTPTPAVEVKTHVKPTAPKDHPTVPRYPRFTWAPQPAVSPGLVLGLKTKPTVIGGPGTFNLTDSFVRFDKDSAGKTKPIVINAPGTFNFDESFVRFDKDSAAKQHVSDTKESVAGPSTEVDDAGEWTMVGARKVRLPPRPPGSQPKPWTAAVMANERLKITEVPGAGRPNPPSMTSPSLAFIASSSKTVAQASSAGSGNGKSMDNGKSLPSKHQLMVYHDKLRIDEVILSTIHKKRSKEIGPFLTKSFESMHLDAMTLKEVLVHMFELWISVKTKGPDAEENENAASNWLDAHFDALC